MRFPQLVVCAPDDWAADQLRELAAEHRWVLRSVRQPAAGLDVSTDIADVSSAGRFTDELELRRYACPGCGVLLATDVVRRGSGHRHDIELLTGRTDG